MAVILSHIQLCKHRHSTTYPIIATMVKHVHLHLHCMAVLLLSADRKDRRHPHRKTIKHDDVYCSGLCQSMQHDYNYNRPLYPYLAQSSILAVILSHITTMQSQAQYHISHHCTMVKTCTFTSALHGGAAIKAPTKTEDTLIAKLA
ncbi:hypothetical protein LSTR_LSTR009327 [Laodelphax striatellus]|uniref:Uncharacterized protein n=1 Tax=Laodelphax striatellus TaxID=195883 RepID=A0A482XHQ9_LAOST|nr:hypothetical protein LSTR_LSTR009327 [Laodelphax striatellus]